MLHVEKIVEDSCTCIRIKNRLFALIAIDGVSQDETERLCSKLYEMMGNVGAQFEETIKRKISHLWWENQNIAILFITGDVLDSEVNNIILKAVLKTFCDSEINVPNLLLTAEDLKSNIPSVSRLNVVVGDEDGEFSIITNDEIFIGAFRVPRQ